MISDIHLRRLARELDVRLGYAEKNYINSWILQAIYTSSYGDNLLFKGGTALSKLYFPETWRYSEDLDFGVEGDYRGSKAELQDALEDTTIASDIDFEVTKHRELQRLEGAKRATSPGSPSGLGLSWLFAVGNPPGRTDPYRAPSVQPAADTERPSWTSL